MQKESLVLDTTWQFKEFPESARRMRDLDSGDWLDTTAPASIYTCLHQARIISIPDQPSDFDAIQWVDQKNWVFRKEFDIPPSLLEKDQVEIIFDGLDTVAHIWLNDKLIGKTENMFIAHRFHVKPYLKQSGNRLYIKFISAPDHADHLLHRYGTLGDHHLRDSRAAYIRKAQYQFGSGFAPALTGCGIVGGIGIEAHSTARIENLHLRTVNCSQHQADIRAALEINRIAEENIKCKITITGGGLNLEEEFLFSENEQTASTVLHIERPFLWWPAGYGIPHLYHIKVDLFTDNGQHLDTISQDFGIRTVHIETSPEKSQCIINGQPICLKGADWMPPSLFPETQTAYEDLIKTAKKCHLNMLRITAAGIYESPAFYELCDQMGILVWQDFMFDSAYYPDRKWFLDIVKDETQAIIKRLRNHACVALWCGNNNIDHLHNSSAFGKGRKFYGKPIFHDLLPKLTRELDPDREYIPTHSNTDPENQTFVHHAPKIPSLPNLSTLSTLKHFKNSFAMAETLYRVGDSTPKIAQSQTTYFTPPQNLSEHIWQSQVSQARKIQAAIEKIRLTTDSGSGMLGELASPALSVNTAILDSRKQPKALFYYARRFFAPVLVALLPEDNILKAHIVNDTASPITGVLSCRMIAANGQMLDTTQIPLRCSPFSRTAAINLPKSLTTPDDPTREFLSVSIQNNNKTIAENTYFFCPDKNFHWPIADIDLQINPNDEQNTWNITLTSEVIIRDLQITPPQPADISDNFLTLLPNEPKEIQIQYHDASPPIRTPLKIFTTNQIKM